MATHISILISLGLLVAACNAQSSCSNLFSIVSTAVTAAVANDSRMGASLLRLHFHDCFVNGCDGSVLLDDNTTFTGEKSAPPNANSLRGFEVIDAIKTLVEAACPGQVSCADILAIAARDGVVALGGPTWTVSPGRNDSLTANSSAPADNIPGPGSSLSSLLTSFANKGFNENEMVALSGSHTIGQARCTVFRNRLTSDTNINAAFLNATQVNCPNTGGDNNLSPLDVMSPTVFNNDYYTNLMTLSGLLHSDQELFNNGTADAQVRLYANNSAQFSTDFANAMVKMSALGPPSGTGGEIRRNSCRTTN